MAWKKILVVVSRTDTLEQPALRRALAFADKDVVELELFRVVYDPNLESYPLMPREEDYFDVRDMLVQRETTALQSMVETLQQRGHRVTATAVWDYPIYQGIIRRAVATEADLVVSESLSMAKVRGLGSADWPFISGCPVPLLMVKSTGTTKYRHIAAAIDPFHTHDKPAALDEIILTQANEMARVFEARMSAVYCFVPLTEIVGFGSDRRLPPPEAEARLEETSRAAVADLLSRQGIDLQVARLLSGTPGKVLPRFVADEDVDLLAMGALSRGRIADFVIGTTAGDVLHSAECDLLVLKPPGVFSSVAAQLRLEPATTALLHAS